MFLELLYMMVGSWGRAVIEWMVAHQPITALAFLSWAAVLVYGQIQLRRVEYATALLVLDGARTGLAKNPGLTSTALYQQIYPQWCDLVRQSARFIPHRWELWPLPASPGAVGERMGFSPEWVRVQAARGGLKLADIKE